jgi:hypothetical protein
VVDGPERPEGTQERVLNQVLGIPKIAGETPTVRVQRRPDRLNMVQIAVPGRAQLGSQHVRKV